MPAIRRVLLMTLDDKINTKGKIKSVLCWKKAVRLGILRGHRREDIVRINGDIEALEAQFRYVAEYDTRRGGY